LGLAPCERSTAGLAIVSATPLYCFEFDLLDATDDRRAVTGPTLTPRPLYAVEQPNGAILSPASAPKQSFIESDLCAGRPVA
jgi:hypothetical protein